MVATMIFSITMWVFGRSSSNRGMRIPRLGPVVFNLTDFGGVGDGRIVNTKAFERAILEISKLKNGGGGGQLNVLVGYWLTSPFNLTSHVTLFLAQNAIILAIQDTPEYVAKIVDVLGQLLLTGGIDPYVVIKYKSHKRNSTVSNGAGSKPVWNEKFSFMVQYPDNTGANGYKLFLKVMDIVLLLTISLVKQ